MPSFARDLVAIDRRHLDLRAALLGLVILAVWIGDRAIPAALLVGVVGVVATLHAGNSRKAGVRSLVTTLWIIVALTLHDTDDGALAYTAAFALGAAAGAGVARIRGRSGPAEGTGPDDVEDGMTTPPPPTLGRSSRARWGSSPSSAASASRSPSWSASRGSRSIRRGWRSPR